MKTPYTFPFGQPVSTVEQQDRTRKKVFVLGVYASAVHAKWVGADGKIVINALAVASEPYIFWRGEVEQAKAIIDGIKIPPELGKLVPAAKNMNGPSGNALDELFLKPLKVTRDEAWLCDLVPYSCCNAGQLRAIERKYEKVMEKYSLPIPTKHPVPKGPALADEKRRGEILSEIKEAKPEKIVLLGDKPIECFLKYHDDRLTKLSDFGDTPETYGRPQKVNIEGETYEVIALCHPRQAGKLGAHSEKWSSFHEGWVKRTGR